MTAHDEINNPAHYTSHPSGIECIQITRHMDFDLGNAIKYIWRAGLKGGTVDDAIRDLRKAVFYLEDRIDMLEAEGIMTRAFERAMQTVEEAVSEFTTEEEFLGNATKEPERILKAGDQVLVIDGARLDEEAEARSFADAGYVNPKVIGQVGTVTGRDIDYPTAYEVRFEDGKYQSISAKYLRRTWDNTSDIPDEINVVIDADADELYRIDGTDLWSYADGLDLSDVEEFEDEYRDRDDYGPYLEVL